MSTDLRAGSVTVRAKARGTWLFAASVAVGTCVVDCLEAARKFQKQASKLDSRPQIPVYHFAKVVYRYLWLKLKESSELCATTVFSHLWRGLPGPFSRLPHTRPSPFTSIFVLGGKSV